MKANNKIKNVFFDAGYTLFYITPSADEIFCQLAAKKGLKLQKEMVSHFLKHYYFQAYHIYSVANNFKATPENDRQFWVWVYQNLLREFGIKDDKALLSNFFYDNFITGDYYGLFSDVLPTLNVLKNAGFKLGIISNFADTLPDVLKKLGIFEFFDWVIVSTLVGYEKPHQFIFQTAIEKTCDPPSASLHIGDHPLADYQGSQKAGMMPVLLDREGKFARGVSAEKKKTGFPIGFIDILPEGDYHSVKTLLELLEIVKTS